MTAAALLLSYVLASTPAVPPAPAVSATEVVAAWPEVAQDQTRPTLKPRRREKDGAVPMTHSCINYHDCRPINAPPTEQECTYTGHYTNACEAQPHGFPPACDLCFWCPPWSGCL